MPKAFAKPDNVLALAGIALADVVVLASAHQYVPTPALARVPALSPKVTTCHQN